jgi:regulator of protease activity HflC (stomatin/prohibitin superfamily)
MNVAIVLSALSTLAWLLALVIIGLSIVRAARGKPFRAATATIIGTIILALLLTTVSAGLVFVQPTERGVVITALGEGIRPDALEPGLNWVVPFLENVIMYPITRQTYTMSIAQEEGAIRGDDSVEARTADGQIVRVDASVIFSIDPSKVVESHLKWSGAYINNLVRPVSRGVIRDGVSQFRIDEVVSTKRFELTSYMEDQLSASFDEGNLILHDYVLRNIAFSEEYADSVEQKQIAEQLAQQAEFIVLQREQEAEQARQVAQGEADAVVIQAEGRAEARVIEAKAEAEALGLISDALRNNPDLITFEYIQKLSPGVQVMLVPNDNPYLLPLPSLGSTGFVPAP